jgi:hypothetical protein
LTSIVGLCIGLISTPAATPVWGQIVPDGPNMAGTADLPIALPYYNVGGQWHIMDGLPPASTIDIDAVMTAPSSGNEQAGGTLGGTRATGVGITLELNMQGTGAMAGFSRPLVVIPLDQDVATLPPPGNYEMHAAPRMLAAPVQSFDTDMFRLFGQITNPGSGDPDFDLLRVVAGTDFGLPSPGHTTLTQAGPNWHVDSFFDITYRIDFVGKAGGQLSGMSGSTTGTIRMAVPEPGAPMLLTVLGGYALTARRRARI